MKTRCEFDEFRRLSVTVPRANFLTILANGHDTRSVGKASDWLSDLSDQKNPRPTTLLYSAQAFTGSPGHPFHFVESPHGIRGTGFFHDLIILAPVVTQIPSRDSSDHRPADRTCVGYSSLDTEELRCELQANFRKFRGTAALRRSWTCRSTHDFPLCRGGTASVFGSGLVRSDPARWAGGAEIGGLSPGFPVSRPRRGRHSLPRVWGLRQALTGPFWNQGNLEGCVRRGTSQKRAASSTRTTPSSRPSTPVTPPTCRSPRPG